MKTKWYFVQFKKINRSIERAALCLALITLSVALPAEAENDKTTIISFDVPGASTAPFTGTQPTSITPAGEVLGLYFDANLGTHGFLRAINGDITTFDVPGAGIGPFQGPVPTSVTPAGAITG